MALSSSGFLEPGPARGRDGAQMNGIPADSALEIRGVTKSFGAVRALAGIDLSVSRGEALALLGPNGAGKSTLIHIVAGLSRADTGDVSVLGHDVVREYRRARRALGV